ncbi:substrate-binding domain-containing protein [Steroidobacter flavus]|uniref:Substrate-binding domain-containing protein n=1 Tax=Steroidobacter flavus TaxID=1842136 RepID=A0ABV8T4B9_9GAMM
MHDEFLTSLRRPPPAQFARDLKRKLEMQEAAAKRRAWMVRARTILFLIVGSAAFAGGVLVVERRSAEKADSAQAQAQVAPESQTTAPGYRARPLNPTFVPEGSDTNTFAYGNTPQATTASTNNGASAPAEATTNNPGGSATNATGSTVSGGLIRTTQPRVRVATSPLTEALVRGALLSDARTPEIEVVEADSAFVALCTAHSERPFDMIVTSRRMISVEFANCQDNGGADIQEIKLGYQALVLTSGRGSVPIKLSMSDVYLAVAKQTPDPIVDSIRFIPNPNITWDQIGRLEYRPILVFGPARGTPRRTQFEILLLEPGCNAQPAIKALQSANPERHAELCHSLRGDRLYTEVEQNALLIPQYLWSDPNPLVLVDIGFYRANEGQLAGSALEGPEPSYATFADGSYPLARPIYIYADQARVLRSRDAALVLRDLQTLRILRAVDGSFVELDERENKEQLHRRMRKLSGSDLNNK